jgi:hypothetical protein
MTIRSGAQNLSGRAFPYGISDEKNRKRRCRGTVLLNLEPMGGLETFATPP